MKRKLLLSAIFLSALCALPLQDAYAQGKPRLAILPFTGGTDGDGETIAELFSFEPEIDQVFIRVPRTSSIDAIMKEQMFQRSTGLTDSDTIARLGKQYNADYVVAGHIQTLGASSLVLITIIHVESLQQVAGDYREYKTIEEVQGMIPAMAKRIAQASRVNRTGLPKLAVFPFAIPASGVDQRDAEVLAQLIATEVANSGKYAVLPRTSTIQAVMKEHQIQRSDLTEETNIKRIGQALNAQYVLAGNVRSLDQSTKMFTAQILNVENASLIVGGYENYNAVGDGLSKMSFLRSKLVPFEKGGTGPAGGIIFYDKGYYSDGWRYLEAAPAYTEFIAAYGPYGLVVEGINSDGLGSGKRNTELTVERLNALGETNKAAQLCTREINGYKDWFLPSGMELNQMYVNLGQKGLGGFSKERYWSSNGGYHYVDFSGRTYPSAYPTHSAAEYRVRAIRSF